MTTQTASYGRRAFYAVLTKRGTVMVFDWNPQEIGQAMFNQNLVGIIRSIEADGSIPAEEEAKKIFASGNYDKTHTAPNEN